MSPAPAARTFRPDIQGMRALAVLAVVANHAGLPFAAGGYVGVDVFFVISGYLITEQLLKERAETGRVRFAAFYARRARRILPASFTVLTATVIAAMVLVPPVMRPRVLADAIATALYVPNLAFAAQQTDYLADQTPSLFQHYWSLGVEEQFYVLWPAVLMAVWALAVWLGRRVPRMRRLTIALVVALLAALFGLSLVACVMQTSTDQSWAFFSPWTRAWEFGVGALVAFAVRYGGAVSRVPPTVVRLGSADGPAADVRAISLPPTAGAVLAWLGLATIVACCLLFTADTTFPGVWVIVPVAGSAAMILGGSATRAATGAVAGKTTGPIGASRLQPARLLALAPVQWIGAISYSLYLVHWPALQLVQASVGYERPLPLWAACAVAAASVPVAWLLYRFVENPMRRSARLRSGRPRRILAMAGTGSVVLVAACTVGLVVASVQPLSETRAVASGSPSAPPDETSFVPRNLTPDLRHAADDNPALYDDSCELDSQATAPHPCSFGSGDRSVVLFGDSHAAQWFPAMRPVAKKAGYRLVTQTKSGCPAAAVQVTYKDAPYTSCDAWRSNVIAQLQAAPPAAVVIADYTNSALTSESDADAQWERGLSATIAALNPVTKVVVLADTPDLRVSPIACLSAHLTSADYCARPASIALDSTGRAGQSRAAKAAGVPVVDVNDYLCARTCPAIIGDTLVYRDSHHLTATFAAELAGPLARRLDPLL